MSPIKRPHLGRGGLYKTVLGLAMLLLIGVVSSLVREESAPATDSHDPTISAEIFQPSSPASVSNQPNLTPDKSDIAQNEASCFDLPHNLTTNNLRFVTNVHVITQYIVEWDPNQTNNCAALSETSLTISPPLPAGQTETSGVMLGSDERGIFLSSRAHSDPVAETSHTITATDLDGDTTMFTFELLIELDTGPLFIGTENRYLPATTLTWKRGVQISELSLNTDLLHRMGNLPLEFSFQGSKPAPSGIVIDETTGIVTGIPTQTQTGTETVIIIRDWDRDEAKVTLNITVVEPQPPVVVEENGVAKSIDDHVFTATGQTLSTYPPLDLSQFFDDPDSDAMTFAAEPNETGIVDVEVEDSIMTITGRSAGMTMVNATASGADDPVAGSASLSFQVTVPNRPPYKDSDPDDLRIISGLTDNIADLTTHLRDHDTTDTHTFLAETTNNAITPDIDGNTLTVSVAPNTPDDTQATITVHPTNFPMVTATFTVTVGPPFMPPVAIVETIPDQPMTASGLVWTDIVLDLGQFFSDPDSSINYSVLSDDTSVVEANIAASGTDLVLMGRGEGMTSVTITASDPDDNTLESAELRVKVIVPNRPPFLNLNTAQELPTVNLESGRGTVVSNINTYFIEPDANEHHTFEVESNNALVDAVIDTNNPNSVNVSVSEMALGGEEATITINPTGFPTVQATFMVTVSTLSPVPPMVREDPNAIPPQFIVVVGNSYQLLTLDLDTYFVDRNRNPITYTAAPIDRNLVSTAISGSILTMTGSRKGSTMIEVTATDGADPQLGGATLSFSITIPDRPPVKNSDPDDRPIILGGSVTINQIASYFSDPDGETHQYVAQSTNPNFIPSISNGNLEVSLGQGAMVGDSSDITFGPTNFPTVTASVTLTVIPQPLPPVVRADPGAIPNQVLVVSGSDWDPRTLDLDIFFEDPDRTPIDYEASSNDNEVATVEVAGSMLTIDGVKKGTTMVEVTASDSVDSSLTSVELEFTVTVPDRPPMKQSDPSVNVAPDSSTQVALAPLFSDPDDDEMTFDVVKVSGDASITHTGPSNGSLTVVASSSASFDDTATFTVTPKTEQLGQTIVHSDTATVTVTVVDSSVQSPPTIKSSPGFIPDQPIAVSNRMFLPNTVLNDLNVYFVDPNDDPITYEAEPDDATVATVAVSGAALTITGVSPGTVEITVTASDAIATGESLMFTVTVPDRPPFKASDPAEESIPIGGMRTVLLASVFEDPDGNTLTFEGTTSDSLVAIVAPAAGGVLITVRDDATEGAIATITVNPQDHPTITATIDVTVTATTTNPTVPSTNPTVPSTTPAPIGGGTPSGGTGGGGIPGGNTGIPGGNTGGGGVPTAQPPVNQPPSTGTGFSDSVGTTHEANINRLAESGITRGCNPPTNSRFCPDRAVTRGEMATFMVRSFDLAESGSDLFSDDNGNTHEGNINAFAAAGITRGCNPPENTRYCPDRPVTRAQMATFLARAMELAEGSGDFSDTVGSPHANDINRIASVGITRGCNPPSNSRYCPDRAVTRGEMATFLIRAEDLAAS